MTHPPTCTWTGTFRVFGVEVVCHVLSDGRRIIEADSMHKLMAAMGDADAPPAGEWDALARWTKGL
jgi:hypothetical protein